MSRMWTSGNSERWPYSSSEICPYGPKIPVSRMWISGKAEGYPSTSSAICPYGQKIIMGILWFFLDSYRNIRKQNIWYIFYLVYLSVPICLKCLLNSIVSPVPIYIDISHFIFLNYLLFPYIPLFFSQQSPLLQN